MRNKQSVTGEKGVLSGPHSSPAKHQPWNKGRIVGAREPFTVQHIQTLVTHLQKEQNYRELALLMTSVDAMLRVSDLLQLKVSDIFNRQGQVRSHIGKTQQKTKQAVQLMLTDATLDALATYAQVSQKQHADFWFTSHRRGYTQQALSPNAVRTLVKDWATYLKLPTDNYSAHSLRRTKPTFLYQQGVPIETIALLLGHRDVTSTIRYLGLDQQTAQHLAREHDIFNH